MGPVAATRKALQRAGLTVQDLDIVELHEAFAAQALACADELGLDLDKTNLDGGAIALGHPLGATGARITGKAAAPLQRDGKQFALSTQCLGGGPGIATILEASQMALKHAAVIGTGVVGAGIVAQLAPPRVPEIGRAQCMERGCP